jgi:DNA invertase Pin-like site-specific DNA recombinase
MRVGIYARVSTQDKDQNPETQLLPLREFVAVQGWSVAGEFVDQASATDLRGRRAWRTLLDLASKRRIDVILVWKLDRAFRSVLDAANTVDQLRRWGCGLRSYSEPWLDTSGTSPVANLMFTIMTGFAEFERSLIAERVRAGMARARKQGKHMGRQPVLNGEFATVEAELRSGVLSQRQAAKRLRVSARTIARRLRHKGGANPRCETPAN